MSDERREKECPPIYCDPQYIVHDTYVPRYVPYVHPIIHVNRKNIVNVPKHVYQESYENEVRDPGCPDGKCHGQGYQRRPEPHGWWW